MLELCRKTIELLRRHPALWLPYLFAELTAQLVWWVRGTGERAIFAWFSTTTSTSVLGGAYAGPNPSYEARIHALQAYAPVGLVAIYLCVVAYVLAFVLTGKALEPIREEKPTRWLELLASLRGRWRPLFLFAFLFPISMFLLAAAGAGPIIVLLRGTEHMELLKLFTSVVLTAAFGATVWLLLPRSLRLLRPDARAAVSATLRWQGTAFAVAAMLMELAIGVLLQRAEAGTILDSPAEVVMFTVVNGLASNLPTAFLFVFLALLAETCNGAGRERAEQAQPDTSEA